MATEPAPIATTERASGPWKRIATAAVLIPIGLVYVLLVVWAGDTTAYFVGRAFGRHRMTPHVSPKKTWEGAVGSMVGSLLVGWGFLANAEPISSALLQAHLIQRRDGYFALQPW